MSKTHDVLISGFDLDRLEAELQAERALADRLAEELSSLLSPLQTTNALAAWKEARSE